MNAHELLRSIQLAGNRVRSNKGDLYETIRQLKNTKYDFIIERKKQDNEEMPTDYQDSHFYYMAKIAFDILVNSVESEKIIFKNREITSRPLPLYGTVDFDSFNAFIATDDGATIIALNNGLLKFTQKIIELVAKEHYLRSKNIFNIARQELFTRNFIDVMISFHIYADSYFAIPLDLCGVKSVDDLKDDNKVDEHLSSEIGLYDETYLPFLCDIEDATYLWIVAHEYAHLLLGHLDGKEPTTKKLNDIDVQAIDFSWQQEYDADSLGAVIAMQSFSSLNQVHGIYLALICLFLCTYQSQDEPPSHPPARLRINNVFDSLKSHNHDTSHYRNIDNIIGPKLTKYKEFLSVYKSNVGNSASLLELQRYIYNEYEL